MIFFLLLLISSSIAFSGQEITVFTAPSDHKDKFIGTIIEESQHALTLSYTRSLNQEKLSLPPLVAYDLYNKIPTPQDQKIILQKPTTIQKKTTYQKISISTDSYPVIEKYWKEKTTILDSIDSITYRVKPQPNGNRCQLNIFNNTMTICAVKSNNDDDNNNNIPILYTLNQNTQEFFIQTINEALTNKQFINPINIKIENISYQCDLSPEQLNTITQLTTTKQNEQNSNEKDAKQPSNASTIDKPNNSLFNRTTVYLSVAFIFSALCLKFLYNRYTA